MPAVRTRAVSRQVGVSTAERPSLTDTEADLNAEIEAELAILSQAADMLISESNTNLDSFIDPVYIRIRQKNTLDANIQSALLWSQEAVQSTSSTITEPLASWVSQITRTPLTNFFSPHQVCRPRCTATAYRPLHFPHNLSAS